MKCNYVPDCEEDAVYFYEKRGSPLGNLRRNHEWTLDS